MIPAPWPGLGRSSQRRVLVLRSPGAASQTGPIGHELARSRMHATSYTSIRTRTHIHGYSSRVPLSRCGDRQACVCRQRARAKVFCWCRALTQQPCACEYHARPPNSALGSLPPWIHLRPLADRLFSRAAAVLFARLADAAGRVVVRVRPPGRWRAIRGLVPGKPRQGPSLAIAVAAAAAGSSSSSGRQSL